MQADVYDSSVQQKLNKEREQQLVQDRRPLHEFVYLDTI
jgi:hypothetical protein